MFADYGFYLILLCLITSIYGVLASITAAKLRSRRLFRSAKYAASASFVMCFSAAILLWIMFYQRDYSVAYIFKNSSNDLPQFYTLTAFWSSLEGSHFFWTLLLALFAFIGHWTYAKDNEHIMPYVSASLQFVLAWMYWLMITYSDPFAPMFPTPENGQGMNALLQNPYMAIHPPTLFIGYTLLGLPFAYSIAALCFGDITEGWLRTVRRWALAAWVFLTVGIFLGGRWAYVELGWAGYWAWDPVENSSFLPWLLCTALLHSLLIQDKIGHLKRLSIILSIIAFFFCYFGTFITRSGVITSVHSFAQSPIGPSYLIYLAILMGIAGVLYTFRAHFILPNETNKAWGFSRESSIIVSVFLVLVFALIIFIGTMYPIITDWITGTRFNIQAPYFNSFAPWIGLGLIVAMAVGGLVRYQSSVMMGGWKLHAVGFAVALPIAAGFAYLGGIGATKGGFKFAAQIVGYWLIVWSGICLTYPVWERLKKLKYNLNLFFGHNLSFFGAYVAHMGLLIAIAGFLGNYRGVQKDVTLSLGESTDLYGYHFEYQGIHPEKKDNMDLFVAHLKVTRDGEEKGLIQPARSQYPTKQEMLHEIGLKTGFWHDLYVVVASFEEEGKMATFQIFVNPTVRIVWISCFVLSLGGIICLFDKRRGLKSKDVTGGSWDVA